MLVKKIILEIILLINISEFLFAQIKTFDLIPNVGGLRSQSRGFMVYADSNYIYLLGDRKDSTVMGFEPGIWPYMAKFNYSGKMLDTSLLIDSNYQKSFRIRTSKINRINDSTIVFHSFRDNGAIYADKYLALLDLKMGKILKSNNLIEKIDSLNQHHYIEFISKTDVGQLIASVFYYQNNNKVVTTEIWEFDSTLNIIKVIKVPDTKYREYCYWVGKTGNNYELINEVREYKNRQGNIVTTIAYLKIDSVGNIIKRQPLELNGDFGFYLTDTYTIMRDSSNRFIITLNELILTNECNDCFASIPYVFYLSPELDTVYNKVKMYSEPNPIKYYPNYTLGTMTASIDNSGYLTCGEMLGDVLGSSRGFIFKNSFSGDSLWFRKYKPISFESDRAYWMEFQQITSTPFNTYAVAATVADIKDEVLKSWILHIDSLGCLIPGCDEIVKNFNYEKTKSKIFNIYPNVVKEIFYMHSNIDSKNTYNLSLLDLNGKMIKTIPFKPSKGMQYILELPLGLLSGNYFLYIYNDKNELIQYDRISVP